MTRTSGSPVVSRRTVLAGAVAGTATVLANGSTGWAAAGSGDLVIVDDGVANAVVVTPDEPDQQVVNAVADLVRYVQQSTGAELPVVPASAVASMTETVVQVFVGLAAPAASRLIAARLRSVADDGFVIQPMNNTVTILGPTTRGTRYGVYEFLERYVDVRWLLPGPLGEDVPAASTIRVERRPIRETPEFLMRHCSPYTSGIADTSTSSNINLRWGAYLRTVKPLEMGHNLHNVIKISKWGAIRPDFFPILTEGGEHYVPPSNATVNWQPRFNADGIAEAAADEILEHLCANPGQTSYSLGVNDGVGYSIDDFADTFNSSGLRGASESYYRFVNEVAERVTVEFPDITFGLLSYRNVADPPSFPLHDNVVPFLTRDRTCWITPDGEQLDRDITLRWSDAARELGWYDYQTGGGFLAPRVDSEHAARAYQFAADAGVRYIYAECYARWGEGAKQWTYNKLLCNPVRDVDELRQEWSHRLVGPEAGVDLVQFQRLWEKVWSEDIAQSEWIKHYGMRYDFFTFDDAGYLAAVDVDDVHTARVLLNQVSAKVATPLQHARADLLQRAFEYVEASTLSYPRPLPSPTDAASAIAQLDDVTSTLDRNIELAARRQEWIDENKDDPLFGSAIVLRRRGIQWSGWNLFPLWEIASYLRANEQDGGPVRQHAETLAAGADSANVREYARYLLAAADGEVQNLGANTSFDGDGVEPWLIELGNPDRYIPTSEPIAQSTEITYGGTGKSLRIPLGFGDMSVSQRFPVQSGPLRTSIRYFVAGDAHPGDAAIGARPGQPSWRFYNSAGSLIEANRVATQVLATSVGEWRSSTHTDMVPGDAATAQLAFSLTRTDQASNILYLDAAEFTQIP